MTEAREQQARVQYQRGAANRSLAAALAEADASLQKARDLDGVVEALQPLGAGGDELKFDYSTLWMQIGGAAALIVIALFVAFTPGEFGYGTRGFTGFVWILLMLGLAMGGVALRKIWSKSSRIPDLTEMALSRAALFSNGLTWTAGPAEEIRASLTKRFGDYKRGNYSRDITRAYDGTLKTESGDRPFQYVQLHYVDRREEVYYETDSNGRQVQKTRIVYDHFDRFSVVVPGCNARNVTVASDNSAPVAWKTVWPTTLKEFNRRFTVSGETEMACAKFARPATILHIQTMDGYFGGLNIEYDEQGDLCVSFNNGNILNRRDPDVTLKHPVRFIEAISHGIELPNLDAALALIRILVEKSTDSFRDVAPETPPKGD